LHENLEQFNELDVNMYIVSNDLPAEQQQLYNGIKEKYGESVPFISDPEFKIIEPLGMKNNEANIAYRGYGMIDTDGTIVFNTINDHWGEEFEKTKQKIFEEYEKLTSN